MFRSRGIQVSSVVLTCLRLRWHPSQPGVMNQLVEDTAGDGESCNDSELYRDRVH